MAEIYDEREQLEALKRWWSENGTTVIVGLVVGLGGVFGWTMWQDYRRAQAEDASALYQKQITALSLKNYGSSDEAGAALIEIHSSSGYAGMSALVLAKSSFEQNRREDTIGHLQWILDSNARRELKLAARLRLARLMLDSGDAKGSVALLDVEELGPFQSSYEELRGDALVAKKEPEEARVAYEKALSQLVGSKPAHRRIQMKLDELGHVSVATN